MLLTLTFASSCFTSIAVKSSTVFSKPSLFLNTLCSVLSEYRDNHCYLFAIYKERTSGHMSAFTNKEIKSYNFF